MVIPHYEGETLVEIILPANSNVFGGCFSTVTQALVHGEDTHIRFSSPSGESFVAAFDEEGNDTLAVQIFRAEVYERIGDHDGKNLLDEFFDNPRQYDLPYQWARARMGYLRSSMSNRLMTWFDEEAPLPLKNEAIRLLSRLGSSEDEYEDQHLFDRPCALIEGALMAQGREYTREEIHSLWKVLSLRYGYRGGGTMRRK